MTPRRMWSILAAGLFLASSNTFAPVSPVRSEAGVSVTAPSPVSSPTSAEPVDAPTEYVEVPDTPATPRIHRSEPITGTTLPIPIRWGTNGSQLADRCTQWEPLLAELAPPDGWDITLMSRFMHRESGCCPQVHTGTGWRTTQGGDRFDGDCNLSHVAVWHHRSDAGLLQINGINYDPARCKNTCLSVWLETEVSLATLGDPWLNIRAAARLCEFWTDAGSSCYRPWRRG